MSLVKAKPTPAQAAQLALAFTQSPLPKAVVGLRDGSVLILNPLVVRLIWG